MNKADHIEQLGKLDCRFESWRKSNRISQCANSM